MKLLKNYMAIALVALTATSCTEGLMDDINRNNGQPEASVVDGKFSIPVALTNLAFYGVAGSYGNYTSSYTEQLFGTGGLQMARAEVRNAGETASSATFNNDWNGNYSNLRLLKEVIDKCNSGVNEGQHDVLGVAQTLSALNTGILTDMHGDIPYSEALGGQANLTPKIDKQETVYDAIFSLLDQAAANFETAIDAGESHLGSQDLLYGGDCGKWLAFTYALKARYKLHLQARSQNAVSEALEAASKAVEYGFDGAELNCFDDNSNNPWTAFFWSRSYTGSSKTVADLMLEREDPRYDVYVIPFFDVDTVGTPGDNAQAYTSAEIAAPAWLDNGGAAVHLLSKAELYFILAECKARLGGDPAADFATAVQASFEDYAASDPGYTDFSASTAGEYIASLPVTLKEIMVQKYLAQARDEHIETYNDLRRLKALGEEYVVLTNPRNTSSTGNAWPLRLPYGESDVRSNPNVRQAFGQGNEAGRYVFTDNVWWAGGSR